jgi:hypothetical protein
VVIENDFPRAARQLDPEQRTAEHDGEEGRRSNTCLEQDAQNGLILSVVEVDRGEKKVRMRPQLPH